MDQGGPVFRFPKPGRALTGAMIAIGTIWVVLAVTGNWLEIAAGRLGALGPFVGSRDAIFSGEVWRLFTAPLVHAPNSPGHPIMTILGIYFLGHSLEERWGGKKFLLFLMASGVFAFCVQMLAGAIIPKLDQPFWFGGLGMVEAVAVAWALSFWNSSVRLFFLIPVTGRMLLGFVIVMSILSVLALNAPPEGLATPFGGMLAGWFFCEQSPFRRFYLQYRFKQLQAQSEALRNAPTTSARKRRAAGFRVIQGGKDDSPPDKRYLN